MVSDHSHQSHGSANADTLSAPSDLVQLGHVSGAYGIKGWLRIQAYSEHADTLLQCRNWWLQSPAAHHGAGDLLSGSPANPRHHRIQTVREQGKHLVAQVVGITDRTHAEQKKGSTVWVSRQEFSPTDANEYYWVDLLGCEVYGQDAAGKPWYVGRVTHMMDNGAHGVMQVTPRQQLPDGQSQLVHDRKGRPLEVLIPFVDAHILSVDLQAQKILTNWPVELA